MSHRTVAEEAEFRTWMRFIAAHGAITRELEAQLHGAHGLTLSDYDVLVQLSRAEARRMRNIELANAVALTRSGVTALAQAGRVSVVTLALNVADGDAPLPPRLYTFGLSAETEARAVARTAFARGLREGAVVQASNLLAKRLSRAFADEWFSLGGRISDVREFGARADLVDLRRGLADSQAQFIFLAAEADQARTVRPYLNNQLQVFATSQVNDGKNDPLVNADLNGIRFVDMPWLVQPDHAAVMVYPRLEGLSTELQRFYALGIDSCRIAAELIGGQQTINLDGVTGRISYRGGNTLQREPIQAVFRDGMGVSLENAK